MTFIIIVHVIVCIALIGLVLIQRGRGSGLVESFHSVESMFGTKTNIFLTRTTTILSVVFFFTCLSLAVLSVRQSKSLMSNIKPEALKQVSQEAAKPQEKTAATQQTPQKEKAIPVSPQQTQESKEAPKLK